jgi:pyruvate ferredoxin oxidoreductase delta subunit
MDFAIKNDITKAPKTGDWRQVTPIVEKEKCVGCGTCVKYCPEAAISMISEQETKNSKKAVIDYHWCKGCGVCAEVCPVKAIGMKS